MPCPLYYHSGIFRTPKVTCSHPVLITAFRVSGQIPRYDRQYSDCTARWTTEESLFDSRRLQEIRLFSVMFRPSQFYPSSKSMGTGFERPRRGADHSTQSSGEMKNEWSCTSTHAARHRAHDGCRVRPEGCTVRHVTMHVCHCCLQLLPVGSAVPTVLCGPCGSCCGVPVDG
jgi:hypothetical protein